MGINSSEKGVYKTMRPDDLGRSKLMTLSALLRLELGDLGGLDHLLVLLHRGHLGKSSLAVFTTVRFLPSVTSHVTLKAGGLEEAFSTLVAEVGAFVVVLFPV